MRGTHLGACETFLGTVRKRWVGRLVHTLQSVLKVMGTTHTISSSPSQEIEMSGIFNDKRKEGQILENSEALQEDRMCRECIETRPWGISTLRPTEPLLFIALVLYVIAFIFSLESTCKMWAWNSRRYLFRAKGTWFSNYQSTIYLSLHIFFSFISASLTEVHSLDMWSRKSLHFVLTEETFIIT